jgi:hypothetical protein
MGLEDIIKTILKPVESVASTLTSYMPAIAKPGNDSIKGHYTTLKDIILKLTRPIDFVLKPVYVVGNKCVVEPIMKAYDRYPLTTSAVGALGLMYLL